MLMRAISFDAQAVQRHRATILECVKVYSIGSETSFAFFHDMCIVTCEYPCEQVWTSFFLKQHTIVTPGIAIW